MLLISENSFWKRLTKDKITLEVRTREVVLAKAVGDLKLFFKDKYLLLTNVLYIPQMKRNLISISCILEHMYKIPFDINEALIFDIGIQICFAILENNLYTLRLTRANFFITT